MGITAIKWIIHILGFKVPSVFDYTSTKMVLAALSCLLFVLLLGPKFIKKLYALKIGQTITRLEDCPPLAKKHALKKDTPTMGGLMILASMLLSAFLWMDWGSAYTWILLFFGLSFGFLGALDDFVKLTKRRSQGLSGRNKFLAQLLLSLIAIAWYLWGIHEGAIAYYIPFFKNPIVTICSVGNIFFILLSLFVIIGTSNAVNLTDGLDGLAAGCVFMVAGVLSFVAFLINHAGISDYLHLNYLQGAGEIAVFLAGIFGASLGFLWFNAHPAQVFMGDTGSLALGAVLGGSAILLRREFLLAICGGIFVAEALSVILQVLSYRYRNQKRIFLCAPLHHHFEYMGIAETKVVIRFWIVNLLLALVSLGSIKFQ